MNYAREADRKREIQTAIGLYEELLTGGNAELIDYLNVIVLYFKCMDLGYASAHKIGQEIERIASTRALEVVCMAEKKYGSSDELTYWKVMIPFHGWSEPVPPLSLAGDSNVPYLYLASEEPSEENKEKVKLLVEEVSTLIDSERSRYLKAKAMQIL